MNIIYLVNVITTCGLPVRPDPPPSATPRA